MEIEDEYMKQSQVYDNREEKVCKKQQALIDSGIKKVMEKVPKEKILKCFEWWLKLLHTQEMFIVRII